MSSVLDTYLGWELLAHRPDCKRPQWTVDVRTVCRFQRQFAYADPVRHACPEEDCGHGNSFDELTVRIVCRSCGLAHLISGERTENSGRTETTTEYLGYGQTPRRAAGLFLWPGEPWLNVGRLLADEPHDFVVTPTRVDRVTAKDVAGLITQGRGRRGGVIWSACAVADPDGEYGLGTRVRFAQAAEGHRSVAAAAKWIAAQLAAEGGDVR